MPHVRDLESQQQKNTYTVVSDLEYNGLQYTVSEEIQLTAAEAAPLVAKGLLSLNGIPA